MSGTFCEGRTAKVLGLITFVALLVVIGALVGTAYGRPVVPVAQGPAVTAVPAAGTPSVPDTLRALAKLQSFGYHWTTPAGADKALRHWQKVNGLEVDGIVGPKTLASLGLPAAATVGKKATAPAVVRQTPQPVPAAAGDVEQIIRDVWPAELADHAVAIARRESNLQPGVRNTCCWGIFQLNWNALRSHLADWGITSSSQLLDARTNAEAAYQIYLIDGWAPWACHGKCQDVTG